MYTHHVLHVGKLRSTQVVLHRRCLPLLHARNEARAQLVCIREVRRRSTPSSSPCPPLLHSSAATMDFCPESALPFPTRLAATSSGQTRLESVRGPGAAPSSRSRRGKQPPGGPPSSASVGGGCGDDLALPRRPSPSRLRAREALSRLMLPPADLRSICSLARPRRRTPRSALCAPPAETAPFTTSTMTIPTSQTPTCAGAWPCPRSTRSLLASTVRPRPSCPSPVPTPAHADVRAVLVAGVGFLLDSYDIFAINLVISMLGLVFWSGDHAQDGYGGNGSVLPDSINQALKGSTSAGIIIGTVLCGWIAE